MSTAIKIENVSKQYRLGVISTGTLSHDLNRWWTTKILRKEDPYLKIGSVNDRSQKADSEYVWALKDINMEIEQGDVVGIIGKNGAGKSTLLKLLSRVTKPTTGSIKYKGRIASLLEVGTGFHPEMTGRENIYMNGAIMGMTKQEITRKLDEIVDFSGCERYIYTPVKRYSSGMTVRLGFAIAAHLDPEILVVDEVLAVGDAEFQKKAIGKMQDVSRGEGRTVLFVSHNMTSIRKLCKTGVLLNNGQIICSGQIDDVVNNYLSIYQKDKLESYVSFGIDANKSHQIVEVKLVTKDEEIINRPMEIDEDIILIVRYKFQKRMSINLSFNIRNTQEEVIYYNAICDTLKDYCKVDEGIYEVKLKLPNPFFKPGVYFISLGCMDMNEGSNDAKINVCSFEISGKKLFRNVLYPGYIYMPMNWNLNKI